MKRSHLLGVVMPAVMVLMAGALAAQATSFDCAKAASPVEKLVCAADELRVLDDELDTAYRAAIAAGTANDTAQIVRRDEREWLVKRNHCRDRACVQSAYEQRLAQLRTARGTPQSLAGPTAPSNAVTQTGPVATAPRPAAFLRAMQSLEFKSLRGRPFVDAGRVIFPHATKDDSSNIVAVNVADGSIQTLAEGIPGGGFVADDERFLVYTEKGVRTETLVVIDKHTKGRIATMELRSGILWSRIHGNHLLVEQAGNRFDAPLTMTVYHLPDLKIERSAAVTGGNDLALWGDKIVSVGKALTVYDLDLGKLAQISLPPVDANLHGTCNGGPLVIAGDEAVVGAGCGQFAVVDLRNELIEHVITTTSNFQIFAVGEGLIFAMDPDGKLADARVYELASARELARFKVEANLLALQGNSLLAVKNLGLFSPLRMTRYAVEFDAIRSESSRVARTLSGCEIALQTVARQGDVHAAVDACENAGIRGYVEQTDLSPDERKAVERYAGLLTQSLSRYAEGAAILERLQHAAPGTGTAAQIAMARRKATLLDPSAKSAPSSVAPEPPGSVRLPVELRAPTTVMLGDGDRLYVPHWYCDTTGLSLDVQERRTLRDIKRIAITSCDDEQQDQIDAIGLVPGYIVLGLGYRFEDAGRPTVAVVDASTLEVVRKGFVKHQVGELEQWQGRLLACADGAAVTQYRFDPPSASLLPASEDETHACANGDTTPLTARSMSIQRSGAPLAQTPLYRVFRDMHQLPFSYQIRGKSGDSKDLTRLVPREYQTVLALADRDALVLRYMDGTRTRFAYHDIVTGADTVLFELDLLKRSASVQVWSHYLIVALGRDLLVYDLELRLMVGYEKDFIREGFHDTCCGTDGNAIEQLGLDDGRLFVITLDRSNSRLVDLPTYTATLPARDVFAPP